MIEMLAAFALVAQSEDGSAPARRSFMRFSVEASFGDQWRVEVGPLPREGSRSHYWFRRTSRRGDRRAVQTSTRDCPAARPILASVEQLAFPSPDLIGTGRESTRIILDGARYTLEAPALHPDGQAGDLWMTSNVGSPLARWIDAMGVALAPCWRES